MWVFWPCHVACGILVPRPVIEPGPSAVKAWGPNLWTAREFPGDEFVEKGQAGIPTLSQNGWAEAGLGPGSHAGDPSIS